MKPPNQYHQTFQTLGQDKNYVTTAQIKMDSGCGDTHITIQAGELKQLHSQSSSCTYTIGHCLHPSQEEILARLIPAPAFQRHGTHGVQMSQVMAAACSWGPAHPPGYPLFVLLAQIAMHAFAGLGDNRSLHQRRSCFVRKSAQPPAISACEEPALQPQTAGESQHWDGDF